jgi:hypothetical protein
MIEFKSTKDNTWVMRITADKRIEVNENVDVNEAAQKVLDAMQSLLKPQQRTWVALTDDEINDLIHRHDDFDGLWEFAYAVQEELKEKNT